MERTKSQWRIPLADIDLGEEEINAVVEVLRSKWLTMGEVTREFEEKFARYLGVKYAFAVSSGTTALHIAHRCLELGEGDEVICPSLTFVATANSILYTGATPIFADIVSADDLNVSSESILERITPRTRAITVVHYGGYPCDMDRIMGIAEKYNLYVIEDAAHAPGAEYNGRKLGTIGHIGCFSFFSNKNMTTGEGGMIVTNDGTFAERIKLIRSHGMTTLTWDRHRGHAHSYDVVDLGYNYRIDEIRSAIGLTQLGKLDGNNDRRRRIVEIYREHLRDIPGIRVPFTRYKGKPSFHLFPILLEGPSHRGRFIDALRAKGIQTSIHYPPVHLFSYYRRRFGHGEGLLPVTEEVCSREVTLPLYPGMADGDVIRIVDQIRSMGGDE